MDNNSDNISQLIKSTRDARNLSRSQLASLLGVSSKAISHWEVGDRKPKPQTLERIQAWLSQEETAPNAPLIKEALDHVEQMRRLLNSIEYELHYFTNGKPEARDVFRRELNPLDIGYLVTQLEMMADEGKFQRWKLFTSHQFNSFRRVKHDRKGKGQS